MHAAVQQGGLPGIFLLQRLEREGRQEGILRKQGVDGMVQVHVPKRLFQKDIAAQSGT